MRDPGGGASVPPFPLRSGPCLVAGNAACLPDDLARAKVLFPTAPVVAVNGAAAEVKAFALFSYHPERFLLFKWIAKQQEWFGTDFTTHSVQPHEYVDHAWPRAGGSGGSAWGARKVAGMMGFAPVVLVGCPLVPGPYVNGSTLGGFMGDTRVVDDMLRGIEQDRAWHEGALSMSGRTMEILGSPQIGDPRPSAG